MKFLADSFPKKSGPHGHLGDTSDQRTANDDIKMSSVRDASIVEAVSAVDAQSTTVPGIAMPEHIGWIDGMEPQLPENFAIDWNTFFNTLDWL